jgi:hypothetical protein
MTTLERLLGRTRPGDGDCLIWTGAKNGAGYPLAQIDGRMRSVRRVVLEAGRGEPLARRIVVSTTCGCTDCIAPEHLRAATHARNMARAIGRKPADVRARMALARRRTAPKLTLERAREIRVAVACGEPRAAVAGRMGISVRMVGLIVRGAAWREYHGGLHA